MVSCLKVEGFHQVLIQLVLMRRISLLKACMGLASSLVLVGCIGIETTLVPPPIKTSQPTLQIFQAEQPIIPATAAPTPTAPPSNPGPTATPTVEPVYQPCSPLADISLPELPEIISDPYHPPPMGKDDRHQGVDFSYYRRGDRMSIEGVEIQAVLPGRLAAAVTDSFPFGNFVIIETPGSELPPVVRERFSIPEGESLYTLYAHLLAPPEVRLGDAVQVCEVLGQVGKTGNAGVAHLHLEMRHGPAQTRFPVMAYYQAQHTDQERQNYLLWATSGKFLHFDPMDFLSFEP
jgi:murein DD-endopeptidase MepM/ murein hydrolase activator NlpD